MAASSDPYAIDVPACRARQQRFLNAIEGLRLDLVVLTQIEHVQYLFGPRFDWVFSPAAALWADGHAVLIAPAEFDGPAAADEIFSYEAKSFSTLRNDQRQKSSTVLINAICETSRGRGGWASNSRPADPRWPIALAPSWSTSSRELYRLRRRKDPDELARLRKAIAGTAAMHRRGSRDHRAGHQRARRVQRVAGRRGPRIWRDDDRHRQRLRLRRARRPPARSARSKPASCTSSISARRFAATLPTTPASRPSAASRPTSSWQPGSTSCRCSKWSSGP